MPHVQRLGQDPGPDQTLRNHVFVTGQYPMRHNHESTSPSLMSCSMFHKLARSPTRNPEVNCKVREFLGKASVSPCIEYFHDTLDGVVVCLLRTILISSSASCSYFNIFCKILKNTPTKVSRRTR